MITINPAHPIKPNTLVRQALVAVPCKAIFHTPRRVKDCTSDTAYDVDYQLLPFSSKGELFVHQWGRLAAASLIYKKESSIELPLK